MNEQTQEMPAVEEPATINRSFPEYVYAVFRAINLEQHITQKKVGNNKVYDYLPWAAAWDIVLQTFPESDFEFDDPKMFEGTGGEQWVTVNIRQGDNVLTRRWWLPYLDFKNQPVAAPTSLQINNTRMRVLVKALAMCGLGTELYTGEDVPDADQDAKVKGTSVVAAALDGVEIDWNQANGHISTIKAALFNEDDDMLMSAMDKLSSDNDMKLAVWSKLDSKQRAYIKKLAEDRK